MTQFTFSFAIVNWNTKDLLDACLASLYREAKGHSCQILVADNHSSDGSAQMVAEKYPEVILVQNTDNIGFARGHLSLLPHSTGLFHVLVNSDLQLKPGCLDVIYQRLLADDEIGILGCRIIGPDGLLQRSCRRFPSLRHQFIDATGLNRVFPGNSWLNAYKMGDFDHEYSREVDQVMGSFFLIRRSVLDEIGFLDPAYFMYYEEVDLCLRCHQAGYKIYYEADATVYHEGGGSSKMVRTLTIRRTMRSMRHYFKKHGGGWTWFPLLLVLSLDLVTHVVYALLTRSNPLATLKAYGLGFWDVLTFKRASL